MISVLLAVFIVLFCVWYYKKYTFWSSQNVKGPFPFPILGTIVYLFFDEARHLDYRWSKKYGKIYGDYMGLEPNLVIADPDLAKKVLVTDFHIFNRAQKFFEHSKVLGSALIGLHGAKWKRIRSAVSPTFTSGKLRQTLIHLHKPVDVFMANLEHLIETRTDDKIQIKELTQGYALDVIAKFVFALQINSYKQKDDVFVQNVCRVTQVRIYAFLALLVAPDFLTKKLSDQIFDPKATRYFAQLTSEILKQRRQNPDVKYKDFIDLLLESSNDLSNDEIIAQCLIFFFAGLDTISTGSSILLSDMAIHQEAQERIYKEIQEKIGDHEITYESLHRLEYLDAFLHESFRMSPVITRVIRHPQADYQLGDTELTLKAGQSVMVNVYAIHHNEKLFTDPFVFRPERYLPEHKDEPYNRFWFPFGDGPRNCVGIRFAMMEMKFFLINLVKKYRVDMAPGSSIPVKYERKMFMLKPIDLRLKFTRRP